MTDTNTVALVTGGSRGLGLEVARQLGMTGVHVIIGVRSPERGAQVAAALRDDGLDVESVQLDVDSADSVAAAAEQVRLGHDRLDILVNNAGILPEATAEDLAAVDLEMFRRTFETNVLGVVSVVQHFLPLLRRSTAGRIVNVSSRMGSLADQNDPTSPYHSLVLPAYQTSKTALNGITVSLAKALADTPIRVTSVCPGFVRTDLTPISRSQAPTSADEAATVVVETALAGGPTGRFVERAGLVPW